VEKKSQKQHHWWFCADENLQYFNMEIYKKICKNPMNWTWTWHDWSSCSPS